MKGLTEEQRALAMRVIFGSDAVRAANILFDAGGAGVQEWTAKVTDAGAAQRTATERLDNLKGSLEQLRGSVETAEIGIGQQFAGGVRLLTDAVTGAVNAFLCATRSDETNDRLRGVRDGRISDAWRWVVSNRRGVSRVYDRAMAVIGIIGAILSPIGLVVAALVGLGAGFAILMATNEEFRNAVGRIWDEIVGVFEEAFELIEVLWAISRSGYSETLALRLTISGIMRLSFSGTSARRLNRLTIYRRFPIHDY